MTLRETYQVRYDEALLPIAKKLEEHLMDIMSSIDRIDQITARAKSVGRFLAKADTEEAGNKKYPDPLTQIQDQIGGRIVTFYKSDVQRVADAVKEFFRPIEEQDIVPDSDYEFGYFGKHYVAFIPTTIMLDDIEPNLCPSFCELQIKTLYQHAWSEANHDLGYKPSSLLNSEQNRKMAFTSAQSWGADQIFDELHLEIGAAASDG